MKCVYCNADMKKDTAPFSIDRDGFHVHWNALPAWVCTQCGEPYFEKEEVDRVQRALRALEEDIPPTSKVA